MNPIKKLAGQTAVYGVGTILGRVLNFFLLPFFTHLFTTSEIGIYVELYSYVGILVVLFNYGMETAFFRFISKNNDPEKVQSTAFTSLLVSSILFSTVLILGSQSIAELLEIKDHATYIKLFALVLGIDAISTIPFALLRHQNKAEKFASLKLINIVANICLNLFFLGPIMLKGNEIEIYKIIGYEFDPEFGVGYIFLANFLANTFTLLTLLPIIAQIKISWDKELWLKMYKYSSPLLIVGLAGIINESIDRAFLKAMLEGSLSERQSQIGIYGANYKLAMILTIVVMAFRQAAEPFFFSKAKDKDSPIIYATVMKYFFVFCMIVCLAIGINTEIVMHFNDASFHEGIDIVPVILLANLMLGIYYNLSVWYKVNDMTKYGAYMALVGVLITVIGNYILIPLIGYRGSAWTTLACYTSMVVISYFWGKKYYPIPYNIRKISFYFLLGLTCYLISTLYTLEYGLQIGLNGLILLTYIAVVIILEKPQKLLS